ncbi:hypothetical protein EV702DRAFT_1191576 [Suillus placidus]|uniref:Protein kinase domain-containing protein n=1 Tax=Suillus placidus TaxID=48579 RepID=A0A9P7D8P4_9AGAM|nr:hypothetical protein EV702DRAFT_1191576 [Suillus placidus]
MPTGAIGWVIDDIGEVYWILAILWKSCGLFSCGTVCYHVQHKNTKKEYALKDCWVDVDSLDHEVEFLQAVDGVPNVVQLVKCWDVEYAGCVDSTLNIQNHSEPELVNVFLDLVVAHKTLTFEREVLHGDLSPNNLIIHEGKGYFIDFDHAKFVQLYNQAKDSCGTLMGGIPTPESVDHRASDDLKSLFYILLEFTTIYGGPNGLITDRGVPPENTCRWNKVYMMMDRDGLGTSGSLKKEFIMDKSSNYKPVPYFQACHPILEDWRMAIRNALLNDKEVSHDHIHEIIQRRLDNINSFLSPEILFPLLPMLSATPLGTSSPAATQVPLPRHLSQITHLAHSSIPSGPSSSFAPPPPPSLPVLRSYLSQINCLAHSSVPSSPSSLFTPPPPPSPPILRNHSHRSQWKKREPDSEVFML